VRLGSSGTVVRSAPDRVCLGAATSGNATVSLETRGFESYLGSQFRLCLLRTTPVRYSNSPGRAADAAGTSKNVAPRLMLSISVMGSAHNSSRVLRTITARSARQPADTAPNGVRVLALVWLSPAPLSTRDPWGEF